MVSCHQIQDFCILNENETIIYQKYIFFILLYFIEIQFKSRRIFKPVLFSIELSNWLKKVQFQSRMNMTFRAFISKQLHKPYLGMSFYKYKALFKLIQNRVQQYHEVLQCIVYARKLLCLQMPDLVGTVHLNLHH